MILMDTDHFSVLTDSRDSRHGKLVARLADVTEAVLIPVIAVEEQLRGWLAQIHRTRESRHLIYPYERLVRLIEALADWDIARWAEAEADVFERLRASRLRIGTQDLRIASIALANDALLLSANLRDFQQVPGLSVEDWLAHVPH